jgi:NitT/TauT family transport system substrate-binding protein
MVPFNAGPSVIEALFAGDLDIAYCGPSPAINAFVRSEGRVRILAAAAYGGAALVVRKVLAVDSPRDLRKARIASPQIGNTQDIALRQWLADNDLVSSDRGGTVQVVPMSNADILSLFRSREIDAAWVVEPWVSRLLEEAEGRVFLEESSLHRGGLYPTTVLVVTDKMLHDHPGEVGALVNVNASSVAWVKRNGAAARALVNNALERHTGKPLRPALLEAAWERLSYGTDPLLGSLRESAIAARRLGYLPHSDISGIVVEPQEWAMKKEHPG